MPGHPPPAGRTRRRFSKPVLAATAALLTALAVATGWWLNNQTAEPTRAVVAEVVKNHRKQLAPEVVSSSWEETQGYLNRLSFSITPTDWSPLSDQVLVGGRYCSIQGELAAQLLLQNQATGRMCSLYIAPATPELDRVGEVRAKYDGAQVWIWRDRGRIFALVE